MRISKFDTVFVDRIPLELEYGKLYVCLDCNVVVHLCPCGCNEKVVLPIGKDQWVLKYDGEGVTLSPSVGNFQFNCKSHYFISDSNVQWLESSKKANNIKKKSKNSPFEKFKKFFKH